MYQKYRSRFVQWKQNWRKETTVSHETFQRKAPICVSESGHSVMTGKFIVLIKKNRLSLPLCDTLVKMFSRVLMRNLW